jgi:hypothetical protein
MVLLMEAAMRILICLMVLVLMIGCGGSEKAEEKDADKVAEKAIEAHTGKAADLDIDKEHMRIQTKDGEMSITSGKSAKIPDNFPKDIPLYKGLALDMAMEVPNGYSLSYTTKDDMSKVSQWHLNEMTSQGWTKEASMEMGDKRMLVFKKGERGVNLVISADTDQTRISLTSMKE